MKKQSYQRSVMGRLGYSAAVVLCLATFPSVAIGQERGLGPGGAVSETEPYVAQGGDNAPFDCTCTKIEIKIEGQEGKYTIPLVVGEDDQHARTGRVQWVMKGYPNSKLCVEVMIDPPDTAMFRWLDRPGGFLRSDTINTNCEDGWRDFEIKGGTNASPTVLGSKMIVNIYPGPCPPSRPDPICRSDIKFTVLKVEIEVKDTADEYDDVVCRYSTDPAARPTVPCQARIRGLSSGSATVVLIGSKVRFSGESDTMRTLSLPGDSSWVSFNISGQTESTAKNDAVIEAHLDAAAGRVCGSKDLTVLWVGPLAIRTEQNGNFSDDNACEIKPIPVKLGAQKVTGPDDIEPGIAYVVELAGQVKPVSFVQSIVLARDKLTHFTGIESPAGEFASDTEDFERDEPDGNDTGNPSVQDQDPSPNGKIYDWDMPGFQLSTGEGHLPNHTKVFKRFNFVVYAVFQGMRCSNDYPWWARVTGEIDNNVWSVYSRPGHANDNAAGSGSTSMTKD